MRCLDVGNNAAQVAPAHVALHNPAPLVLLPVDLDRAGDLPDFATCDSGITRRRRWSAPGCSHRLRVGPVRLLEPHVDAEPARVEVDAVDHLAADGQLDHLHDLARPSPRSARRPRGPRRSEPGAARSSAPTDRSTSPGMLSMAPRISSAFCRSTSRSSP